MSDVRRLNLEDASIRTLSINSAEGYKLDAESLAKLEEVAELMCRADYWSPEFQAWLPFIETYSHSGVDPDFTLKYAERIEERFYNLEPPESRNTAMYAEVRRYQRSNAGEFFDGFTYESVKAFVAYVPLYIDNMPFIKNFLYRSDNYDQLLDNLIGHPEQGMLSENFIYAVYAYRHCQKSVHPATQEMIDRLQAQVDVYVERFERAFEDAAALSSNRDSTYDWYCPAIKDLICNAWSTSLDLTDNRHLIDAGQAYALPFWLSERITGYLQSLPCVFTVNPTNTLCFNAMEYIFRPNASLEDPNMMYALCLPLPRLKGIFSALTDFYWEVSEGRLVPNILARVEISYASSAPGGRAASPEGYKKYLCSMGYPTGQVEE